MKVLVIIPAYNEEENILDTIKDLEEHFPQADRIVINDASYDETKSVLEKNKVDYIDLPVNLGIGGGVQTGYMYAYERGYDIAVQMDGDGQHCAAELEKIIQPIAEGAADVVIGSRFIKKKVFSLRFIGE